MKIQEIKSLLNELTDKISRFYENTDEVKNWLMAATLYIWSSNKLCAEEYTELIPIFTDEKCSYAQIITALDCTGEEGRKLQLPLFFMEAVNRDKENNSNKSRILAEDIGRFLAETALVNGDFTIGEARALHNIMDILLECCDKNGVTNAKPYEYKPDMITPLNDDGYYIDTENEKTNPGKITFTNSGNESSVPRSDTESIETPDKEQLEMSAENITENIEHTPPTDDTLESVMYELNSLVGLDNVKKDIESLMNFIRVCQLRKQRNMKVPEMSYHLVFTGNPGTGKTTVARLVAKLYYLMGNRCSSYRERQTGVHHTV